MGEAGDSGGDASLGNANVGAAAEPVRGQPTCACAGERDGPRTFQDLAGGIAAEVREAMESKLAFRVQDAEGGFRIRGENALPFDVELGVEACRARPATRVNNSPCVSKYNPHKPERPSHVYYTCWAERGWC